MNGKKAIAAIVVATVVLCAGTAYAWSVQENRGNWAVIRCQDGSNATVAQSRDGYWTVTAAGAHGRSGGSFAIIGQAALYGCGE